MHNKQKLITRGIICHGRHAIKDDEERYLQKYPASWVVDLAKELHRSLTDVDPAQDVSNIELITGNMLMGRFGFTNQPCSLYLRLAKSAKTSSGLRTVATTVSPFWRSNSKTC